LDALNTLFTFVPFVTLRAYDIDGLRVLKFTVISERQVSTRGDRRLECKPSRPTFTLLTLNTLLTLVAFITLRALDTLRPTNIFRGWIRKATIISEHEVIPFEVRGIVITTFAIGY
jgi:hypothetical protein